MPADDGRRRARTTTSPGAGQLAVAAALGGQVDDHRAGRHAARPSRAVTSTGDFLPGTTAAVIDHIALGDDSAEQLALALVKRFVLRLGVAARVLRVGRLDGQFDEAAAQALHLFLGGGPHS